MSKVYLLSLDADDVRLDKAALHQHIKSLNEAGHILNWWHYINSTYLLVSKLDVNTLSAHVKRGTSDARFLLVRVSPKVSQGWLPPKAWAWIKKYEQL